MNIWVDADACPKVIKEIIYRAANREAVLATFVANQALTLPPSRYLKMVTVGQGFDVADDEIVRRVSPQDLVITSDIPLAHEVLEKNGAILTPRGETLSQDTIKERLVMRDFMETLRSSGIQTGGPPPLSQKERQLFAQGLDHWLRITASLRAAQAKKHND